MILDQYIKNIPGWRTRRKIVVISVDDYGNIRLGSPESKQKMAEAGLKQHKIFDSWDTLETKEDLEQLFGVLSSVKDSKGLPAVFTPFAVPCNINFEKVLEPGNTSYHYETLPDSFAKMAGHYPAAYEGAWDLWKEGLDKGYLKPQFHGREHLNLKVFEEKLQKGDQEQHLALKNNSYTSLSSSGYATISYTAAFDFWEYDENTRFREVIKDGLDRFEEVFGYRSIHFNPPGGRENGVIHEYLYENGIRFSDAPMMKREHQGNGKIRKKYFYTGKRNKSGMTFLIRNAVFEPLSARSYDCVAHCLNQVEAAFFMHKPAIISSHRINYSGFADPQIRQQGLDKLKTLLQAIVKRWPDVEFMSSEQLCGLISKA